MRTKRAVAVCAQLALVSVWTLLGKVRHGAFFSPSPFEWVNRIVASGLLATELVADFEFHLLGTEDVGEPRLGIVLSGIVVAGAAFTLVVVHAQPAAAGDGAA